MSSAVRGLDRVNGVPFFPALGDLRRHLNITAKNK